MSMSSFGVASNVLGPAKGGVGNAEEEVVSRPLRVPLQQPGSVSTPFFDRHDVTTFLKSFVSMCNDSGLERKDRVHRLGRYCAQGITSYVTTLPEYHSND